jgi:hypothetical protein
MKTETCTWTRRPDDEKVYAGQYESTCGMIERLADVNWCYCPYCGDHLIVKDEEPK